MAQLRAVVLNAGGVPEAFCDGYIEGSAGVILCTFMQVGGAHDLPENTAVKEEEAGDPLHFAMEECIFAPTIVNIYFCRYAEVSSSEKPSCNSVLYSATQGRMV